MKRLSRSQEAPPPLTRTPPTEASGIGMHKLAHVVRPPPPPPRLTSQAVRRAALHSTGRPIWPPVVDAWTERTDASGMPTGGTCCERDNLFIQKKNEALATRLS